MLKYIKRNWVEITNYKSNYYTKIFWLSDDYQQVSTGCVSTFINHVLEFEIEMYVDAQHMYENAMLAPHGVSCGF